MCKIIHHHPTEVRHHQVAVQVVHHLHPAIIQYVIYVRKQLHILTKTDEENDEIGMALLLKKSVT